MFGTQSKLKSLTGPFAISCKDATPLQKVEKFKYLGVWLDPTLSFKVHVDHIVRKVNWRINMLYRSRSCFSRKVRLKLVNQLILPIFDYCDVVYYSATNRVLSPLNKVFNRICRFALECPYRTHHCTMYQDLNLTSLQSRRQLHWLQFIYKCINLNYPPYLQQYLVNRPTNYLTRQSTQSFLSVPSTNRSSGRKAFRYKAPNDWNQLPHQIRTSSSLYYFNVSLSSYLDKPCICH